jgi:hypothetical protein
MTATTTNTSWVEEAIKKGDVDCVLVLPEEILKGLDFDIVLNMAAKAGSIELCEFAAARGAKIRGKALGYASESDGRAFDWILERWARDPDAYFQMDGHFGRRIVAELLKNGWKHCESKSHCSKASFEANLKKNYSKINVIESSFLGAFTQVMH